MIEYQNADYRSIWVSQPFRVPKLGQAFLVIIVEDMQECDEQIPDKEKFWTALCLVAPLSVAAGRAQTALDFVGWRGERGEPTAIDKAVALAEAGDRIVLWEAQTGDWKPDLAGAKAEAAEHLAHPVSLVSPFYEFISRQQTTSPRQAPP